MTGEGQQSEGAIDIAALRSLANVMRLPDRANLRPTRGGFGGFQAFVEAGNYTVVLKVGDKTSTQPLTVIRAEGLPSATTSEEEID